MSGLEGLAIAASVLQIADLAATLSLKLFEFSRKTRNVDKSVEFVSKDIKSTGIVLHQLAIELSKDEARIICSRTAIDKTEELISECREVFHELDQTLDAEASSGKTGWNLKRKLKFSFLESHIELLRSNLDRLRSSLMLMVGTLTFASQMKNHEALQVQIQQRKLMQSLLDDLKSNQESFERLRISHGQRIIDSGYGSLVNSVNASISDRQIQYPIENIRPSLDGESATITGKRQLDESNYGINSLNASAEPSSPHTQRMVNSAVPKAFYITRSVTPRDEWSQLVEHCTLVRNILFEIKDQKYRLDHIMRGRISKSVHHSHWLEWKHHRKHVGDQRLLETLNNFHSELAEYWESQIQTERLASEVAQQREEAAKEAERVRRAVEQEQEFRQATRQEQTFRQTAIEEQERLRKREEMERLCQNREKEIALARYEPGRLVRTPTDVMRARRDREAWKSPDTERKIKFHEMRTLSPQQQAWRTRDDLFENVVDKGPQRAAQKPSPVESAVSNISTYPSVIQDSLASTLSPRSGHQPYNAMPTQSRSALNKQRDSYAYVAEFDPLDELVLRWTTLPPRDLFTLKNEVLIQEGLRK